LIETGAEKAEVDTTAAHFRQHRSRKGINVALGTHASPSAAAGRRTRQERRRWAEEAEVDQPLDAAQCCIPVNG